MDWNSPQSGSVFNCNQHLDAFLASCREQNATGFEIATGANAIETSFRKLNAGRMDVVLENENVGLHTIRSLKLEEVIDVAGCNNQWVVSLHVSVSSKRRDAQKILSRINNGVAALRRSGELGAILAS